MFNKDSIHRQRMFEKTKKYVKTKSKFQRTLSLLFIGMENCRMILSIKKWEIDLQ